MSTGIQSTNVRRGKRDADRRPPRTDKLVPVSASADIVIVGGGCMGASTAYHLTRRGVTNLILVEREAQLGAGSTGRNAGGVRHQFSTEANIRLSIESIGSLETFRDDVGFEIDFHQDGYLFLLARPEHVEVFRRNVDLQRRMGIPVEWLDASEAARLAPGLDVTGVSAATFCARDGIADPNGVTMGFARAAQQAGARIQRETEVVGLRTSGGRIVAVETNRGVIGTRAVVNAAGPQASIIGRMAGVDIPVAPYRRHIFIAQSPTPGLWERPGAGLVPSSRIMVIDFETTFYFHREGPGVLFGMSDPDEPPGYDTTVRWDFLDQVTRVAMRRLPALGDAAISHAWAGLYEMTPDAMPIIGAVDEVRELYVIAGFSGHGFQHSPAAGRILADMIVGRDPGVDVRPFRFERFAQGALQPEANVV
ncbi:MAG: FAD-binding oxidoreductase [Acidobacteria bacterium]|nr:FAD-binding oxidoreductase [Acidobacteriota bacterium]